MLLLLPPTSLAALPRHDPVPGGVAVIDLGPEDHPPAVRYGEKRVLVLPRDGRWYAVVGLGLQEKPGPRTLEVRVEGGTPRRVTFEIGHREYETQRLTLKNRRMVNPYKKDLDRIARERKRILSALRHWQERPLSDLTFFRPAEGPLSSRFGLRRYFNDQPRKPHSGLDIAAPRGTPVVAPLDGTVIEAGDFFFNGRTLFLDHGQGLVTMYCHLEEMSVRPGDRVRAGEPIGRVGSSGRVTGPHLHWSVSLNGVMVNPELFLDAE
ncbi:MAG TPA: M23 family metallopeptidase [Thiotrichales bacterium]|nr:M23 family metallopeptidase [Thiotrichales bacterium]